MYSHAQLTQTAMAMRALPAHQNPALTPGALNTHIKSSMRPVVAAVLASPQHRALASGGSSPAAAQTSSAGALNPKNSRVRNPHVRHQMCGMSAVSLAAAVATGVTGTPYNDFTATRCVISPTTISGNDNASSVSQWQVGSDPQFVSLQGEPLSMYANGSQASFLNQFDMASPAISITAQVTSPNTVEFYAGLFGDAPGSKPEQLDGTTKPGRLPIPSTPIAPSATTTVSATTTKAFIGRKIVVADLAVNQFGSTYNVTAGSNGASGLLLQQIFVGNQPQFVSTAASGASIYFPAGAFMGLYDDWVDLSKADISIPIQFVVYNPGTVTLLFAGVIEGDFAV